MTFKSDIKKNISIYVLLFLLSIGCVCGAYIPKSELQWGGEIPPINTTLTRDGGFKSYLVNIVDKPLDITSINVIGSRGGSVFNCTIISDIPQIIPPKGIFLIESEPCTNVGYSSYATIQIIIVYNIVSEDGKIIEENKTTGSILITSLPINLDNRTTLESDATYNWLSIDEKGAIKRLPSEEDVEIQQRDMQRTISIVVIFVLLCAWFYLFKVYKGNNKMRKALVIILVLFILLLVSFYLLDYFTKGSYGS